MPMVIALDAAVVVVEDVAVMAVATMVAADMDVDVDITTIAI